MKNRPKPKPCNCTVCGEIFERPHSLIVTCSPECRRVRMNAKHAEWRAQNRPKVKAWFDGWRTNNADRFRELQQASKARLRARAK